MMSFRFDNNINLMIIIIWLFHHSCFPPLVCFMSYHLMHKLNHQEQQCTTVNEQQCNTVTETTYENECTTVQEQKCEIQYMTQYEQQCTTQNENVSFTIILYL